MSTSFLQGSPQFNIVDIDPAYVAKALTIYIERGSKRTGVSLDEITLTVDELPTGRTQVTLSWLIEHGMKLFDAIVWLSAGQPDTHPLIQDNTLTKDTIPSLASIADSVFYNFFFLLTQARYPVTGTDPPRVANFLTAVMGFKESQQVYVRRICSFEAEKFDPSWIKFVNFQGLGQEALSRFGLGVAGYRLFGPFKSYSPKEKISADLQRSYNFARKIATSEPTWDIHPVTRNPTVLTKRGNLNKNLGNLILEVFSEDQIAEMVSSKMLYARPIKEATHRNYLSWTEEDDISGNSRIFRDHS